MSASRRRLAGPVPVPGAVGNLDGVTRDGRVAGWCWYPSAPEAHASVEILVDDTVIGSARAVLFRPDLRQAGIGDGTHGFSFVLPWSLLEQGGRMAIAIRDEASGVVIGPATILRLGAQSATEDRVIELERQVRRLRAEIVTLSAQMDRREATAPTQDLFVALGLLFTDLGRSDPAQLGVAGADLRLRHALAGLHARHPPLTFAVAALPVATIVVGVGHDLAVAYRCLAGLHAAGLDHRADIVLADDGAGPADMALMADIVRNLRILRPDGAAAAGAAWRDLAQVSDRPLIWLSARLRPEPLWFDLLLDTLAREPEAAVVSGRVVGEDGVLRHAGIGVGADGLPFEPGALDDAALGSLCFLREVDAAAPLGCAVRPAALLACGALPERLVPDAAAWVALCLRLRGAGHRILVQPQATAICCDGAELGVDLGAVGASDAWAQRPASPVFTGHALVVDTALPRPDHDAGSLATLEHLLVLRRLGYRVSFGATEGIDGDCVQAQRLEALGIELVRLPEAASISDYLLRHGPSLDIVQLWRHDNARQFLGRVRILAPRARLIFSPADLHHLREARRELVSAGGARASAEAVAQIRAEEFDCARAADATIVHSDFEFDLLRGEIGAERLRLLRWIARPVAAPEGFGGRSGVCFIGSFGHSPNADGLRWFLSQIMPRLRAARPGLVLHIAGPDVPADLAALAGPDIEIHGWIDDLSGFFARMRLSVAPLRYGAGFKGKVATSLSFGVPVVGTSIAAEGTGLGQGQGLTVADRPQDFARAIVRLHDSEASWRVQSARGLEQCRALYSPEAALGIYSALLAGFACRSGDLGV